MTNVEALCAEWIAAKQAETDANNRRLKIEAELTQAFDIPQEGSKTYRLENYKVAVSQPVYRKVDAKEWDSVKGCVPVDLWPIKEKIEVDATGAKWLQEHDPETWRKIARAFETKPGKVSVKVEKT